MCQKLKFGKRVKIPLPFFVLCGNISVGQVEREFENDPESE